MWRVLSLLLLLPLMTAQTLYNDTSKNIHDTYDPICDGTDSSIVWCDGFEDGTFWSVPNAKNGYATNDRDNWAAGSGWGSASDAPDPVACALTCTSTNDCQFSTGTGGGRPDPDGNDYTNCNGGTIDEDVADFGAAGTPCTATMDYISDGTSPGDTSNTDGCKAVRGWDSSVLISIDNGTASGDAGCDASADCYEYAPGSALTHFYTRFYMKESGVTSTRCPSGVGSCPAFHQFGSNGYKGIQHQVVFEKAGIHGGDWITRFYPGSSNRKLWAWNTEACSDATNPKEITQDTDCNSPGFCDEFPPDPPGAGFGTEFIHYNFYDQWLFVEMEVKYNDGAGIYRLWMDECGRAGLGCTGTPTLRAEITDGNFAMTGGACDDATKGIGTAGGVKTLWFNFWNQRMNGEIQFDEIVVRDATVTASPIGFAPIMKKGAFRGGSLTGGSIR